MSDVNNSGCLSLVEAPQVVQVEERFVVKLRSTYVPGADENIVCHCTFERDNQDIAVGEALPYLDECDDGMYVFENCLFYEEAEGGSWSVTFSLSHDDYENNATTFLGMSAFKISVTAKE